MDAGVEELEEEDDEDDEDVEEDEEQDEEDDEEFIQLDEPWILRGDARPQPVRSASSAVKPPWKSFRDSVVDRSVKQSPFGVRSEPSQAAWGLTSQQASQQAPQQASQSAWSISAARRRITPVPHFEDVVPFEWNAPRSRNQRTPTPDDVQKRNSDRNFEEDVASLRLDPQQVESSAQPTAPNADEFGPLNQEAERNFEGNFERNPQEVPPPSPRLAVRRTPQNANQPPVPPAVLPVPPPPPPAVQPRPFAAQAAKSEPEPPLHFSDLLDASELDAQRSKLQSRRVLGSNKPSKRVDFQDDIKKGFALKPVQARLPTRPTPKPKTGLEELRNKMDARRQAVKGSQVLDASSSNTGEWD